MRPRAVPLAGPVYAIADLDALAPLPVPDAVAAMAGAGVPSIQIRAKHASGEDLHRLVERCSQLLEGAEVDLWIDDRADLAALFAIAGVHLGQRDLPPSTVRGILGAGVRIGSSTHDVDQLTEADRDPAVDLIAFGPIFSTTGKQSPDPVVGLAGLRRVRALTVKPLVAIGGITAENVAAVLAAGADAVAVIGAVCRGDVGRNCRDLLSAAA
jgi:thiamine-phosphate pyrophosphorylase